MEPYDAMLRILLALILGSIVGLEREFTQKTAGLRTHILVTLGSTIFTWVSLSDFYAGLHVLQSVQQPEVHTTTDPSRVAAQVVTGIGFIGGGAVLRYGTTVRGLTTAASLWTMASIGMLVGIGQFKLATFATLLTFLVLFTVGKFESKFFAKPGRSFNRLRIHIIARTEDAERTQTWMETHHQQKIIEAKTKADSESERVEMNYILTLESNKMDVNQVSRQLCRLQGVLSTTVKSYYEQEDIS